MSLMGRPIVPMQGTKYNAARFTLYGVLAAPGETNMRSIATFENAKHEPAKLGDGNEPVARSLVKAQRLYQGALLGESAGDLLVCQISEKEFGYVGMDLFKGSLDGRSGSFIYQHGELNAGGKVKPFGFIVTGSGTGALKGIEGNVLITVSPEWIHTITLDWEIAKTAS